jgi:hypothetical protein
VERLAVTGDDTGDNHSEESMDLFFFKPVIVRQNLGKPSNVVYSFVLGIKWKRMSRYRIYVMSPWHPWAFCAIQDGVQDDHQFKQTSRTPLLFNIERWYSCLTLRFRVKEFIKMVN